MASAKVFQKGHPALKNLAKPKANVPFPETGIVDNGDQTFTVVGVDAAGNPVDLSTLATLAVLSSDTTKLTADMPATPPLTFAVHAVGPLTVAGTPVVVTVTVTLTAGGAGPFSLDCAFDVKAGGPTGLQVIPGPVTLH